MVATSDAAYVKSDSKSIRNKRNFYSSEEIRQIVDCGDPIERAALSDYFFTTNGLYKRIILHYATFLTYSWILVPYVKDKSGKTKLTDKKVAQQYYDAADFCVNFQVERKCTLFAKEILVKGAYYGLIHETPDGVVIQDLPFEYCRSRFKNENDVDIVEFNLAFFNKISDEQLRYAILDTYPKIIQKAYRAYVKDRNKKWIFLPAEMGIYFSLFEERPFFLDLIPLLDDLEDYKEIDKQRNIQALKRILVQQVLTDGMKLVFEPDEAQEMHDGAVQMLSNNEDIDVLTTYNKVQLLDMSSTDDEKTEIKDVQDLIFTSAGLSKELFYSTTEAGLNYSVNNDLAMMMILGQRFSHFFSTLLNYKFEDKKIKFKLLILPISYYNSTDYTSRARELASFGYTFLTPVLSTGLDQTTLDAIKILENDLLNLDEVLKPLQSSYTQTGKQAGQPIEGEGKGSSQDSKQKNDQDSKKDSEGTKNEEDSQESSTQKQEQKTKQDGENK